MAVVMDERLQVEACGCGAAAGRGDVARTRFCFEVDDMTVVMDET